MVRLTDHLDMTIAVDWDVKPQTNQSPNKYHICEGTALKILKNGIASLEN